MDLKQWLMFFAAVGTLAQTNDAEACSWVEVANFDVADIASPERIAFTSSSSYGTPEVTVTDEAGIAIPGTVESLDERSDVLVFIPDEPLPLGQYEVAVAAFETSGSTNETVEVVGPRPVELSFDSDVREFESIKDMVCCDTEPGGCFDSCATCVSCWPSGYLYVPEAEVEVRANQPLLVTTTIAAGDAVHTSWTPRLTTSETLTSVVRLWEESNDDVCVTVEATDLDGNPVFEETRCVVAENVETLERRTPDEPEAVRMCAEAPDDTSDANWKRYGNLNPLPGCSTSGNPTSGLVPMLLLLALLLGRRRGWS